MGHAVGFWFAFGTTLLLLGLALWSGFGGRRRLHLWAGPVAMVSLTVTVVLTEQLMRSYRFPEDALSFHLVFAKSAGMLALPVIVTGVWLWRRPAARRWHKLAVLVFALAAVLATATGFWLMQHGEPR